MLTLAKREPVPFDHEAFAKAAKRLYDEGKFTADLLDTDEGRGLTEETYNALNGAISYSIQEETPSELTAALRNNAFIFSGFKTYHQMREAGRLLTREDGSVRSYGEFESEVKRIDEKYNTQYLYAEYNHAVHTSQMAAKWHEWSKDGDEYNLQYRTAGDERVRDEHAALDGVTLPPSDKFWDRYLPPNGWNCRCQVVQVLRDDYALSDSDRATEWGDNCTSDPKAQMFRYNAGKEMKLFPPKHPYLPKGCGKCEASMQLAWGLGKPECASCLMIRQMAPLETITPRTDKPVFRRMQKNARNAYGEEIIQERGKQFYTSRFVCSKDDFDKVIGHCYTAEEVEAARKLPTLFSTISNGKYEPLHIDRPNIRKKIANGAIHFVYYEIEIEGVLFELQTIAIKNKNERHGFVIEHPYSLKKKESE